MKASNGILTLIVIVAAAGCGGSSSPPTTPSNPVAPAPPTTQVQPAVFSDPASSFTTSDVRDAQEQIVRFDTASGSLVWAADGRMFQGFPVTGNFIRADQFFQVRFGTKDGERRAYFTETVATTICDIEIVGGQVVITPTNVHVPGS